jgi:hypothetical protein
MNLLDVTIGAEFILFAGYFLYIVVRQNSSSEDRYAISFYTAGLIGFITFVLILNSTLSLSRFTPSDIPIVLSFLAVDIAFLCIIIFDAVRLRGRRHENANQ